MGKIIFSFVLFIYCGFSAFGQGNVIVNLKENTAYVSLPVDPKGIIKITSFPDTLILVFPKQDLKGDFLTYSLQFNNADSSKFTLSFNCSDSGCIPLLLEDVHDNKLKLVFKSSQLIGISDRLVTVKKTKVTGITGSAAYIQILHASAKASDTKKPDDPFAALTPNPKVTQKVLQTFVSNEETLFYCSAFRCPGCNEQEPGVKALKDPRDPRTIGNDYSFLFLKPSDKTSPENSKQGRAVTPRYRLIYDARKAWLNQDPVTFLKYKNASGYEYYKIKKDLYPRVYREMVVTIIGHKDSVYLIDSVAGAQNFLDQQSNFASAIASFVNPSLPAVTGNAAGAGLPVAQSPAGNIAAPPTGKRQNLSQPEKEDTAALVADSLQNYRMDATAERKAQFLKNIFVLPRDFKIADTSKAGLESFSLFADQYVELYKAFNAEKNKGALLQTANQNQKKKMDALTRTLQGNGSAAGKKIQAQIQLLRDSLSQLQASLDKASKTIDTLNAALGCQKQSLQLEFQSISLKRNLLGLERALELFNHDFYEIDFREKEYRDTLICLKLRIKNEFAIPVPDSAADLSRILAGLAAGQVGCRYFTDFKNLISAIQTEYAKAVSKKAKYAIFDKQVVVPNTDLMSLTIHSPNSTQNLLNRSFSVSGGLKIDFSTGFFFNGLSSTDFILGKHSFRYKDARDSITAGGGIDTLYTGNVRDTTGNLVQSNTTKFSYSVGFLAHIYTRTGGFLNFGIATGISLSSNSTSPINIMLGPTVMAGDGSSRLSFTWGVVLGQQKTLSAEALPYVWNQKTDHDNNLYNSVYSVPVFYSGSNDIPTYSRWKTSWFAGITYNLASLKIGK